MTVHTSAQTTEIPGDGSRVNALKFTDRRNGEQHTVELAGVVELSKYGEIMIDAKGSTSAPGIFAAGDVTTVPFKQIIIATGEGSKSALAAFDYLIRTPTVELSAAA